MKTWVGTSAWSYKDWKGPFYPDRMAARDYLAFYARRLPSVEVDASFYAEPAPATLDHWCDVTPPGFRFALKVPRALTHERLMAGCGADLLAFVEHVRRLGERLGPVILQLPPSFTRSHLPQLFEALGALPLRPGVSVEFRHTSCFSAETFEQLRSRGVGLVTTDSHSGLLLSGPDVVLRLLGQRGRIEVFDKVVVDRSADMEQWAERLEQLPPWVENAWVFVSNHYSGHAPETALALARRLGLPLPPPDEPGRQTRLFG